jgi:hypothetical protein
LKPIWSWAWIDMIWIYWSWSQCASEHIDYANKSRGIPFDSHRSIHLVVPEARSRYVQAAVSLLHDDAIGDELEVFVDCCDVLQNLEWGYAYVITDLVGPNLGVVDVVVLIGEVVADHVVDLFLNKWTDIIEHRLLLFAHYLFIATTINCRANRTIQPSPAIIQGIANISQDLLIKSRYF